jgi:hypothetical protein
MNVRKSLAIPNIPLQKITKTRFVSHINASLWQLFHSQDHKNEDS